MRQLHSVLLRVTRAPQGSRSEAARRHTAPAASTSVLAAWHTACRRTSTQRCRQWPLRGRA
eukprot:2075850-Lingulodinium_polyedra.AAC.1